MTWDELERELFTEAERAKSLARIAKVCKRIEKRNRRMSFWQALLQHRKK